MTDARPTLNIADSPTNTVTMTEAPKTAKKPKSMAGKHQAPCPVCLKTMRADNIFGSHFKTHLKDVPTFMASNYAIFEHDKKSCFIYNIDTDPKANKTSNMKYIYCLVCNKGVVSNESLSFYNHHRHTTTDKEKAFETHKHVYGITDELRKKVSVGDIERLERTTSAVGAVAISEATINLIVSHDYCKSLPSKHLDAVIPSFVRRFDDMEDEIYHLKEENDILRKQNEALQTDADAVLKTQLEEAKKTSLHWEARFAISNEKCQELEEQIDPLTERIQELEKELEALKTLQTKIAVPLLTKVKPVKKEEDDDALKESIDLQLQYLMDRLFIVEGEELDATKAGKRYYNDDIDLDQFLENTNAPIVDAVYDVWKDFISGQMDRDEYIEKTRELLKDPEDD